MVKVIRNIKKMQALSRRLAAQGKKIGLVPTMGFLHDGHLSLIKSARRNADIVVTSIFVNPAQFGPNEDLRVYPRDEKGDIKKISAVGGDIVFAPAPEDIYPAGYQTVVGVLELTRTLEGEIRPGHFEGVTTIVSKLFNIVQPDIAVFGMKDFQQAAVIKRMTRDLDFPIRIIVAPTVREKDGLAMSSRNKYFKPKQRPEAICLYKALILARNSGVTGVVKLRRMMEREIYKYCPTAQIDYIAFTDPETLEPRNKKIIPDTVGSLAVKVHGVRLIDNMKLA
jgi:pantoate--beta-alanine ligase